MSLNNPPQGGSYRGRVRGGYTGSQRWITYPDPFFDIAGLYLPDNIKDLFQWCSFYATVDPIVSSAVGFLAEYPVTKIGVDDEDKYVRELYEDYFKQDLNLRARLIDVGLHYQTFGNALVSLLFPFVKMLTCPNCGAREKARDAQYKFRNFRFHLTCRRCGVTGVAEARDQYLKTTKGARLLVWDMTRIDSVHSEITGRCRFYYNPPVVLVNSLKLGTDPDLVTSTPQALIESVQRGVKLALSEENVYHIRRPTVLSSRARGLGAPPLLPVLRNLFHITLMRKAQEAALSEKLLPFQTVFPQAAAAGASPFEMVNLVDWEDRVYDEIMKWRRDPLHIAIMPIPMGYQALGGEGRALLVTNEIRSEYELVLAGMGVSPDIPFGGASYAGSNVTLRMMENKFLAYRAGLAEMIESFIIRRTAAYMDWPLVRAHVQNFKMADDLQRKAFLLELNTMKKVSTTTLQREADLNPEEENRLIKVEVARDLEILRKQQMGEAEVMGEVGLLQAKYQAKAQQQMALEQQQMMQGQYGVAPGESGDVGAQAPLDPAMLQSIPQLPQAPPEQYPQGGEGGLPLPEVYPPRRGPESALI